MHGAYRTNDKKYAYIYTCIYIYTLGMYICMYTVYAASSLSACIFICVCLFV